MYPLNVSEINLLNRKIYFGEKNVLDVLLTFYLCTYISLFLWKLAIMQQIQVVILLLQDIISMLVQWFWSFSFLPNNIVHVFIRIVVDLHVCKYKILLLTSGYNVIFADVVAEKIFGFYVITYMLLRSSFTRSF